LIRKRRYRSIEKYLRKNLEEMVAGRNLSGMYGATDIVSSSLKYAEKASPRAGIVTHKEDKESQSSLSLADIISKPEESFSQMLFRIIRERGVEEVDTYKNAHIDRKLFSKIRSNDDYSPGKTTALSLALALKLSLDETLDLLGKAGYTLSHSNKFDLIIEYFIQKNVYDIFEINEALDVFGQPPI
jgi:hypothetical protein